MPPHDALPYSHPFRRATLAARKPTRFDLRPDEGQRAAIAADLGLIALPSVALTGELRPTGRQDYVLEARLLAEAVQACVVTNDPVTARIDEPVVRRYLAGWQAPEGLEVEMPEDDSVEPLTDVIDAGAVLVEALALALPPWPRSDDATGPDEAITAAPPGADPLGDERPKPFAGLADLLKGRGSEGA